MNALSLADPRVLKPYVSFLEERGSLTHRLLDQYLISREMLDSAGFKITKWHGYRFLEESARREGLPDLGYRVGASNGLAAISDLGGSILRSPTLLSAINTLSAQFSHWIGENRFWHEFDGDSVWLLNTAVDGLEDCRPIANQCGAMFLISLVRSAAGNNWQPDRIRVGTKESRWHENYEATAAAEVEFTRDLNGVRFPRRFLSWPMTCPVGKDMGAEFLATASNDAECQVVSASFSEKMEEALESQVAVMRLPTLRRAAEMAGISPRTLQRRLLDEGLTYQNLIDRLRFRIARKRLEDDACLSMEDLAADLGYGTPSSFIRAFRRLAGVTPTEFRCDRHRSG
jgi:AraC-like DNA-binding protein